jgi:hypothetical protein
LSRCCHYSTHHPLHDISGSLDPVAYSVIHSKPAIARRSEESPHSDTSLITTWANELKRITTPYIEQSRRYPDRTVIPVVDVCLRAQQHAKVPLLAHLAQIDRWDLVSFVSRIITEDWSKDKLSSAIQNNGVFNMSNHLTEHSLKNLTDVAIGKPLFSHDLDVSGPLPDLAQKAKSRFRRAGAGHILRSLGTIVLDSYHTPDVKSSQVMMDNVLNILAILHHHDILPDETYWFQYGTDTKSLVKVPVFAQLSQLMLLSILDAEWNTPQQTSEDDVKFTSMAQFPIPGFQFSDVNNPTQTLPYAHSVWLEFILWICLEGGWLVDGLDIIHKAHASGWHFQPWSDIHYTSGPFRDKVLSSQVLSCYIDSLSHAVVHPEATKGLSEKLVLNTSLDLMKMLPDSNMAHTTRLWHRSINSTGAFQASFFMDSLAAYFDEHVALMTVDDLHAVFSIYNRSLSKSIREGSFDEIKLLLTHVRRVQDKFTKHEFKEVAKLQVREFIPLMERIMSEDISQIHNIIFANKKESHTLFPEGIMTSPITAPVLIRYAVRSKDMEFLQSLLDLHCDPGSSVPGPLILLALYEAQVEAQLWSSVQLSIDTIRSPNPVSKWHGHILAYLGRHLLIHSNMVESNSTKMAGPRMGYVIFRNLIEQVRKVPIASGYGAVDITSQFVLDMLASVDERWEQYCRSLLITRRSTRLPENGLDLFKVVLDGVIERGDRLALIRFWKTWFPQWQLEDMPNWDLKCSEDLSEPVTARTAAQICADAVELELTDGSIKRYFPSMKPDYELRRILQKGFRQLKNNAA